MSFEYLNILASERQGFDTSDFGSRSKISLNGLSSAEYVTKNATKTGTTICGCVCKDGIVLASDTRATAGPVVADGNCQKLQQLSDNIWCAGAGTAADLQHVTRTLRADLELFSRQTGRIPRVETCVARLTQKLFKYQGHISVALIIGGVDPTGETPLFYVSPHGYSHRLPFMAMGSGGYFAATMLEAGFRNDLTIEQGKELVADAIEAGIRNDMGSGSFVDVLAIRRDAPTHPVLTRKFRAPAKDSYTKIQPYRFPIGTTKVIAETRTPILPFAAAN